MHLSRLLICARDLLRRGRLVLHVGENRDRLLAVRRGQVEWAEVEAWRMAVLGPRPFGPAGRRGPRGPVVSRDMTRLDRPTAEAALHDLIVRTRLAP